MLKAGDYYVGDPGFVLPNDDLRIVFQSFYLGKETTGVKELVSSARYTDKGIAIDYYWHAVMPHKRGTMYDENNKGVGFDWGLFGCVPWEFVVNQHAYTTQKVFFPEPFTCQATEDEIVIGNLHFTFNPK